MSVPVQNNKNAPWSYIHFAWPWVRHLLPISAPCWSPTRPPSGTLLRGPYARFPYTSPVETRRGKTESYKLKKRRSTGSHSSVRILSSSVRDALVTLLMCWLALTPPSRFCLSPSTTGAREKMCGWRLMYADPGLDGAKREVIGLVRFVTVRCNEC